MESKAGDFGLRVYIKKAGGLPWSAVLPLFRYHSSISFIKTINPNLQPIRLTQSAKGSDYIVLVEARGIALACGLGQAASRQSTGLSPHTQPFDSLAILKKHTKSTIWCVFHGGEGNRTPVRKSIHATFSGCRTPFFIPARSPDVRGQGDGSLLMHDGCKS